MLIRSTKQIVCISAVLVALAVVLMVAAAQGSRAAGTVKLSNGKSVYIGETTATLENDLKSNLRLIDNGYRFVGDSSRAEGVIFVSNGKVTAIRVTANGGNKHLDSKIGIATRAASIDSGGIKKVSRLGSQSRLTGYVYKSDKTVGYFLTNPCVKRAKILSFVIARSGNEAALLPETTKVGPCEGDI